MNKNLLWVYALSAIVFWTRGIGSLPGQSFFYYLKETLKYDQSTIMYLGSLITLAWLVKPLIGYMIDFFGISKKIWIIGSILITSTICIAIGLYSFIIPLLIVLMMIMSFNDAVANVAVDGVMCVLGKRYHVTGRIQSVQWAAITLASILTGVIGGWLAEKYNYQVCHLLLIPFFVIMLLIASQYKEDNVIKNIKQSFWTTLKDLWADKQLRIVCLFIFLYNFSPSFGTPLMFIQRDTFHFSKIFIGWLGTIGATCSVLGAWLYWHFSKKIDLNKWLLYSVFIGAVNTLAYLYFTPVTCVVYDVIGATIGMFLQLVMLDFFARKTPHGKEAMCFALLTSVSNITGTCNQLTGAWLFPHIGLNGLILLSAFTSFLCIPLLKKVRV